VDPTAGLEDMGKQKYLTLPGLELRPLRRQPVAIPTTLTRLLICIRLCNKIVRAQADVIKIMRMNMFPA
jgi:hypothetical protein